MWLGLGQRAIASVATYNSQNSLVYHALLSSCLGAAAGKMAADTGRYRSAVSKNKDPSGLLISVIR